VQYLYNELAGRASLELKGDEHRYIFKVRRHRVNDKIYLRNLEESILYCYIIEYIDKKEANLRLESQEIYIVKSKKNLHIGWCIIEPKNIEKILPTLNEMGVAKITFIYCERSQKSFKLDFNRLNKILLNSSQQSGRSILMELDRADNLNSFLQKNKDSYLLNFSKNIIGNNLDIKTIIVGCEGGLSDSELSLFNKDRVVGFDTSLILKSESAVCAVASKLLL